MTKPDKTELLQAFLDTSKWATEMFDVIDSDEPVAYRDVIGKTNTLIAALSAARDALVVEYVLSGAATNDFLANVKESLNNERNRNAHRRH